MAETDKLKLPKITGNMAWDVVRDLNALAEAVDVIAGKPDGIAVLNSEGKLPAEQLGMDTGEIASKAEINEIKGDVGDKEQLSTENKTSVVDAVNEIEQKRESLEQEVTSHMADEMSYKTTVSRDVSITGVQSVSLPFKPKLVLIESGIPNTSKASVGKVDRNSQSSISWREDGKINTFTSAVGLSESNNVVTRGYVTITDNGIDINWTHNGGGAVGTANLYITALKHGG